MRVRVYINEQETIKTTDGVTKSHWFGYSPGDELRLAIEYDVPAGPDASVLEDAFRLFNIEEEDPRAVEYRSRRNRSLSVGDVVEINDRRYACEMLGWKLVPA
jgi:hypothetical protein